MNQIHHQVRPQLRPLPRDPRAARPGRDPDQGLPRLPAGRGARRPTAPTAGWRRSCARSSRSTPTTRRCASSTSATSSGSPRYTIDECRKLRLTYGYPVQDPRAPDQARAGRGGGLPRRDPDHDRRRRVHHQRLRARDRQPAAPLAGRRLLGRDATPATRSCTPAGSSPSAAPGSSSTSPRRTSLTVRIDQSGKFSRDHASCARWTRSSRPTSDILRSFYTTKVVKKTQDPDAERLRQGDHRPHRGGRHRRAEDRRGARALGRCRSPRRRRSRSPPSDLAEVEVIDARARGPRPADHQHAARGPDQEPRGGAAQDLQPPAPGQPAAAREGARALPREVLRRAALPPRPRRPLPPEPQVRPGHRRGRSRSCSPRTSSTRSSTSSSCAPARARSTTSTTSATAACARSPSWPATSSARASSSCAAPRRSA